MKRSDSPDDAAPRDAPQQQALQSRMAQRLRARQRQLVEEVLSVRHERSETPQASAPGTTDMPGDPGDQAEQRSRQAVRDAEALRDQDELRDIEAALERITAGRYGECVDCGVPIAARRLDVQPAAARCLPCQERWEQAHPVTQRLLP